MRMPRLNLLSNGAVFALIVAFALIVRVIYLVWVPSVPVLRYFNFDEADYELLAQNLARGEGLCYKPGEPTLFRAPLYPLFIAGVYTLVGRRSHTAVRFAQALLSATTAGLLFLLGTLVFGRAAGVWAGILMACYPTMLYYVPKLLSETLFIFLLAASLLSLVLAIRRGKVWLWIVTGFLFGLTFLCRLVLLPFLLLLLWPMALYLARRGVLRRPLVGLTAFYLAFGLAICPWVIRNYNVSGHFVPTDSHLGWVFWHNTRVHFDFDADFARARRELASQRAARALTSERFFDAIQKHSHFALDAQQDAVWKAYRPARLPQTELEISQFFLRKAIEFYRAHKLRFVRDRTANFLNFWMPISSIEGRKGEYLFAYGVILVFAAIGLFYAIKGRRLLASLPLLAIVVNFWLTTTLVVYHSRLKMPADIATILFAGYSIDAIRREKGLKWLLWIAATAIGLNLVASLFLLRLKELVKTIF